ncbi:Phosphatidylinositol 4-kinase LSB6 [Teratosphaeriaceae sp. CCFEE 6253]|nr:Phosphatidylinositol 4-kinase LSB6 [Teratosphaeriaceae sp. CCFEE 6253]
MPRSRPATSGYTRIVQAEEEEEEDADTQPYSDHDLDQDDYLHPHPTLSSSTPNYAPIHTQPRSERMHLPHTLGSPSRSRTRRRRTNSGVDIKALNLRLERWAEEIKERFTIRRVKGKSAQEEHLEIYSSVFQAPEGMRPATKKQLDNDAHDSGAERLSRMEFDDQVESVRTAIELGMHPLLISQGSSGSYFARNTSGKVLGVFKPKDEEPYANKNPKWTKWIHRNLFPFAFGRAMLIPNLSYVSEAAAYVLDCQLRTGLVPYTDVVSLSSKSFHYDFWERRAFYRKRKPLPEKQGSFQVFLKGYKGATEFFREHPWPDQSSRTPSVPPRKKRRRRWAEGCRPGTEVETDEEETMGFASRGTSRGREEFWTEALQQSFREELEKLVILDYVMRNTDRGTDNWMIRIDKHTQSARLVMEPPKSDGRTDGESGGKPHADTDGYLRPTDSMTTSPSPAAETATCHVGAIDNSLSWPWKHPDAWRSYPFGWLFLPVALIGRPFSAATRAHFLPLLTSKDWWHETQILLRRCFEIDADFQERMYARQMAVMKGQAWNVVEALKTADHGPLELTRRSRVLVWDDVVEVPVAVPMVRPSEEMRRVAGAASLGIAGAAAPRPKAIGEEEEQEEMDISAALASAPARGPLHHHDVLGSSSPEPQQQQQTTARGSPFNYSRESGSSADLHRSAPELTRAQNGAAASTPSKSVSRPARTRSATQGHPPPASHASHDLARPSTRRSPERRRRFSLTMHRRRSTAEEDDGEDGDGDLGYAAVGESEGHRRKVIVERIEMVKRIVDGGV